jgi:tRNA pseudouridine65 synthase
MDPAPPLVFVYQDDDVAVVDKPAGVIVHRGWANDDNDLLRRVRDSLGQYVFPLHRLDRSASGAVAFARSKHAASVLGRDFAEHRVTKVYVALVRGLPPERGVIDHPIPKAPGAARVPAVTVFRRLAVAGRYALVVAKPLSGRLHQIRRHLKHISCPLIGDVRYGQGVHNRLFRERYGLHRLALHAAFLGFRQPRTGVPVEVSVPVSGPFRDCLRELGVLAALDREAVQRGDLDVDPDREAHSQLEA